MRSIIPLVVCLVLVGFLTGACGPKEERACLATKCAESAEVASASHQDEKVADPHAHEGHADEKPGTEAEKPAVPAESKPASAHGAEVVMPLAQQTLAGLVIGKAEVLPLREALDVPGNIPDEPDHLVPVTAPQPCVLTRLVVSVGENVAKGQIVGKAKSGDTEIDLLAPQSGTVLALPRNPGETVDAYSAVALLADLSALKVSLSVGEDEVSRLRVGQKVQVFHLSNPKEVHTGRVTALSPRVDPETRLVRVGVQVDNANRHLRLGMYVTARFMLETGRTVLSVPEGSVQRVAEVETVYRPVPGEADAFFVTPVKTGERRGGRVEILSGLKKGESLVVEGAFYLKSAQLKGKMGDDGHGH
jgi:cobalt-zinc-cadmium efflux system membrane fusion protein